MPPDLPQQAAYAAARQALLDRIVATLSADERFVAGWLVGSFGRGQGDAVSDLDLTLVVTDAQRDALCARPWMVGAGTTARRLAVLQLFGEPAVIHENHHNAPPGGTFTFTLYAGSALMVDWVFVPLSDARRPPQARVLFSQAPIPPLEPASPATQPQRIDLASERVSFFWMMAAVAAKYRARGDLVNFYVTLATLHRLVAEIAALVSGAPGPAPGAPPLEPAAEPAAQAEALRLACRPVLALMPEVERLGGHVPPRPMEPIETLLDLR